MRLGIASLLLPRFGPDAIWWSFPASAFATVLMATLHYRLGRWRTGAPSRKLGAQEAEEHAAAGCDACGKLAPAS